jgi:hypothetical protein
MAASYKMPDAPKMGVASNNPKAAQAMMVRGGEGAQYRMPAGVKDPNSDTASCLGDICPGC